MGVTLTVPGAIAASLQNHLAAGREEQLAFMLATPTANGFTVTDIRAVDSPALDDQTPWHLVLADQEGAAIVKWAHEAGGVLVEAHVHRGAFAAVFSPYDLDNLAEWVPHVWWRLRHRPYVALVFSGGMFDGLAWAASPTEPVQVDALIIDGAPVQLATGLSLSRALQRRSEEPA